jgi:glucokinase
MQLSLNSKPDPGYFLGIEIGGTKLQLALGDARGAIHRRFRFAVDRAAGAAGIRERIADTLAEVRAQETVAAVGVGFGGPVDWRTGRICCSHHVHGWSDFPLGDWLRELTGRPVAVDNDANVAALGEARAGAGRGHDPVLYVTLGSGVGGGLVCGGAIYHGAPPGEVEIGHVRLDRAGATVESRCSGWAVDRKIRRLIEARPQSLLAQLVGPSTGGEARHLGAALAAGNPEARQVLEETATDLAFGLSHAVHLLHPALVVLGGGLSLLGEPLRAAVAAALPGFLMEAFRPGPAVALAALAEDAVPAGALLLAGALMAKS